MFLAVSAFRDLTEEVLARTVVEVAAGLGLSASVLPGGAAGADRAAVFRATGGWCVVVWPGEFSLHDIAACQAVTRLTGGVASSVHVYDGDYWTHAVVAAGSVRDVFCSMPGYFDDDPALSERYAGRPEVVADAFGADRTLVARYLRPAADAEGESALEGDRYTLDDPWVFTDLWARLGISYPQDLGAASVLLDLGEGWSTKFPDNPAEI